MEGSSRAGGALALIGAAVAVAALTVRGPGRELDRRLYRTLNRGRGGAADASMKTVTELGSIWAASAAALSRQAKSAAKKRGATSRKKAAAKATRTRQRRAA